MEVFDEAMKDKDYLDVIDKRLTGVEMKDIDKLTCRMIPENENWRVEMLRELLQIRDHGMELQVNISKCQ